jgi:hypothetical protein
MKKLLKAHGLNSDMAYYQMIVDQFLVGQMSDAKMYFVAMPRGNRIEMLKALTVGGWEPGLGNHKIASLFDIA